jgi:hypothetical protein
MEPQCVSWRLCLYPWWLQIFHNRNRPASTLGSCNTADPFLVSPSRDELKTSVGDNLELHVMLQKYSLSAARGPVSGALLHESHAQPDSRISWSTPKAIERSRSNMDILLCSSCKWGGSGAHAVNDTKWDQLDIQLITERFECINNFIDSFRLIIPSDTVLNAQADLGVKWDRYLFPDVKDTYLLVFPNHLVPNKWDALLLGPCLKCEQGDLSAQWLSIRIKEQLCIKACWFRHNVLADSSSFSGTVLSEMLDSHVCGGSKISKFRKFRKLLKI